MSYLEGFARRGMLVSVTGCIVAAAMLLPLAWLAVTSHSTNLEVTPTRPEQTLAQRGGLETLGVVFLLYSTVGVMASHALRRHRPWGRRAWMVLLAIAGLTCLGFLLIAVSSVFDRTGLDELAHRFGVPHQALDSPAFISILAILCLVSIARKLYKLGSAETKRLLDVST
ncbi:MAG: hypothetical protein HC897_04930 [Thermoanaerobaculia bacterium]|nr:hypothetical protein [Thermoanaerobaculia bacterium]